jgi:acyl-CoA thioester hydrolase
MEEVGHRLPVVEVWAKYRGEVKYDDTILVKVWLAEMKRAAIQFRYEVVNLTSGATVTEGYSWHVVVGTEMKAKGIPADFRSRLERDPDLFETVTD